MTRVIGMALAVLWAVAGAASAQPVEPLDPVVITATKVETPASRVGASVTVITEDELQTYDYTRIEDALRQVPGVEVQRSGGPGKATETLVYKVYNDGFVILQLGSSAAQSVILMVIVITLTAFQFRYIERRVHYG